MIDLARRINARKRASDGMVLPARFEDSYWQATVLGTLAKPWRRSPTRPSVQAIRQEDFEAALEILGRLNPTDAQVYFLRWYEGLTAEEIAERLSVSRNAVYKRLGRAVSSVAGLAQGTDS
jgi:RNA polymerase sigma factor (sigma-70 family)